MDNFIANKLRQVVDEKGRSILNNPAYCEQVVAAEVMGFSPVSPAIVEAIRAGVPAALAQAHGAPAVAEQQVQMLQRNGMPEYYAREAVAAWTHALGVEPAGVKLRNMAEAAPQKMAAGAKVAGDVALRVVFGVLRFVVTVAVIVGVRILVAQLFR